MAEEEKKVPELMLLIPWEHQRVPHLKSPNLVCLIKLLNSPVISEGPTVFLGSPT